MFGLCGSRIDPYNWVSVGRGGVRSFSFRRMAWLRSRRANLALRSRLNRALSPLRADMVPQGYQNLWGAIGQIVSLRTSRLWCSRMSFRPPGDGPHHTSVVRAIDLPNCSDWVFADSLKPSNPAGSSYSPDMGVVATVPPTSFAVRRAHTAPTPAPWVSSRRSSSFIRLEWNPGSKKPGFTNNTEYCREIRHPIGARCYSVLLNGWYGRYASWRAP